jgi:hypothetical protein
VDVSGHATFTTSSLKPGRHFVIAVYSGDNNLTGSTSATLRQVVKRAGTTTLLTSSPNPARRGETVTFNASVVPDFAGTVSGTVLFIQLGDDDRDDRYRDHDRDRDDHTVVLGSSSVDSSGHARFATSRLGQGDHFIVAVYLGDDNLHSSRSAVLKQVVEKGK